MMNETYGDIIRRHQQSAPVDITALANDLGLTVLMSYDLPAGISGKIALDPIEGGTSGYAITVNALENRTRKRFTVAHECGHFLLHRDKIGDELTDDALYRSDKLPTSAEYEANNMAADLLMPNHLVSLMQRSGLVTATSLAGAFGVSVAAMEVRLRYLSWSR
jgi:hypothetical protein